MGVQDASRQPSVQAATGVVTTAPGAFYSEHRVQKGTVQKDWENFSVWPEKE